MQTQEKIHSSLAYLEKVAPFSPDIVLVLGSGLGKFQESAETAFSIPYSDIPHFPFSTVKGHNSYLHFLKKGSSKIGLLSGRVHLYEGYTPEEIVLPLRTLSLLGAEQLIITNAAGALNPLFRTPSLMLISDHINFTGKTPLLGPNCDKWGPRFPDMSQVYSPFLTEKAEKCALDLGIPAYKGIYMALPGPALETPAETRAFRFMGADAIGMSTVLESIAARHMGMEILGISCLTNKNLPDCMQEISHEEILKQAEKINKHLENLLLELFKQTEKEK